MIHWKVVGVMNIVTCAFYVCFFLCLVPAQTTHIVSGAKAVGILVQCAYGSEIMREYAMALNPATDVLSLNTGFSEAMGTLLVVGSR